MTRISPLVMAAVVIVAGCSRQDWATVSSPLQRKPIPMPDSISVPIVKNAAASEELFQTAKRNCWNGTQNRYLHPTLPNDGDYMENYLHCMRLTGNYVYFPNEPPDFAVQEGNRIWAVNTAYIKAREEEQRVRQARADFCNKDPYICETPEERKQKRIALYQQCQSETFQITLNGMTESMKAYMTQMQTGETMQMAPPPGMPESCGEWQKLKRRAAESGE